MKTPFTRTLLLAALGLAVAFTACKKDDDNSSPSSSGGQTTPPTTDPRSAFTGTWLVTDSLWLAGQLYTNQPVTYVLSITTGGTASDTLWFNNLWNDGANYYAILANNFFSFPSQQVSGPYYLSGNGTFNGTHLFYQTSGDEFVHHGYGEKQ